MAQAMMMRRSGGSGLDLALLAIGSSLLLPASAANGTVAIVTGTAPGKLWVGRTAPASGMQSGDIFIRTTGILSFGLPVALEERALIYPAAVYQYAGGAWAMLSAYFRIGGAWVPSAFAVYSEGDQLSGTWSGTGLGTGAYSLTGYATYFVVSCSNNANGVNSNQYWATNTVAFDVTEYAAMHVLADVANPNATGGWGVAIGVANTANTTFVASAYAAAGSYTNLELTVDIAALTGSLRPQVYASVSRNESVTRSLTVKRVWFTR